MSVDRWRRRGSLASNSDKPLSPSLTPQDSEHALGKKPRVLTKALRSLSNSSIDSMPAIPSRSSSSQRRLQKTTSGSSSMIERFHRRVSRDSAANSPTDISPSPLLDSSHSSMQIVKRGWLRQDPSSRKSRSDYLVLTDQCISRFASLEAARVVYPQIAAQEEPAIVARSASSASIPKANAAAENRLNIPLNAMVAVLIDPCTEHVAEVWWSLPAPRLAYCRTQLSFNTPQERAEWHTLLHRACRQKLREGPLAGSIPDNVLERIRIIVRSSETVSDDSKITIFPVVRRLASSPKAPADDSPSSSDGGSSYYLAIGPFLCYFIEILRSDHATPSHDLMAKVTPFGIVTLSKFQASVANHEQTFVMCFRMPFGKETRLTLASVYYRRIIETLIKMDRILKPTWPQHLQQAIFDIRGLSPPLQLTSGNDLGGFDISLPAYCAAFQVPMPNWRIDWNTPSQPCFCLLPAQDKPYGPYQLLAVFRALRYNGFFKAVSFADVDLTPLIITQDFSHYADSIVYASANRVRLPEDLSVIMSQSSVLGREIHSLLFASDSLRSINLSNVFGIYDAKKHKKIVAADASEFEPRTSELLRPISELLRRQLSHCHSIVLSHNPISSADADELRDILTLPHVRLRRLELAQCGLGEFGLSDIWSTLDQQTDSLEILDLSNNPGIVQLEVVCNTLRHLSSVTKLCIARTVRLATGVSLFDDDALVTWQLQELDLSGMMINDATVESLAKYLAAGASHALRVLRLNCCGLNGFQVARLLRSMGPARDMHVHMDSSRIDAGVEDLCDVIGTGLAPQGLFLQNIDCAREESYVKVLRALALNSSIECLSLAGTSIPDAASETACQAVFDFLAKNNSVRYLDMSGYDSKLDEGRLGRGFSRALGGLRHNTQIEHLRVRSQMLNINVGDFAEALAVNKILRTVDCSSNDFTLSNLRYLITKLEHNRSIRNFSAFKTHELDRTIAKSISDAAVPVPTKRPSMMSRFKSDKNSQPQQDAALIQELKSEWDHAIHSLQSIMDDNLRNYVDATNLDGGSASQASAESEAAFAAAFGGLAAEDYDGLKTVTIRRSADTSQRMSLHARTSSSRSTGERPDSVGSSEATGSPSSEAGSSESGAATPIDVDCAVDVEPAVRSVQEQWPVYGDSPENNYSFADGTDADAGLQMKRYRRFQGDPTDRIEEEDHAHEADKSSP
ncbi:leucine rich repeat protein [Cordyceps fumosorosea ARSEF 2679]|uniref:Leucine rich repeat protein n=1 Tax=Cordyceps fumosorosea (strain ARSEF 2679) TaxID=1081104 RepID=A0A162LQF7_CORFA|nr:leucine rich repeat protein [Cordyceps fumosorosea ARSEF 2679]OAA74124.1 leucine rich repeat protein [Cordyceps fumosorosea ARSEF 2679]